MTREQASAPGREEAAAAGAEEHDLTLNEALELAVGLMRQQRHAESRRLFETILAALPEQPDALQFFGVLHHCEGDSERGLALIRRAAELMPGSGGIWNNLGNVLLELKRYDEAQEAYRRSVEADPDAAGVYNNLGALLRRGGHLEPAERACRRAVELQPDLASAWYNLSRTLIESGRIHDGLVANSKAIALWPRQLQARDQVIHALLTLGEFDEAARLYRDWLDEDPDNPVVRHQLAACAGGPAPPRASDACVEKLFDEFAGSFDAKLEHLGYRAPELVDEAVRAARPADDRSVAADLGCGTGLVGVLLRPRSARLVGCDLSGGMLSRADQRGVYDELHKAELVEFLDRRPGTFDVVVSADTLCYFGDLAGVSASAHAALRDGGTLVFTVEASPGEQPPHRLQPNGRYAHTRSHVETSLRGAGFGSITIDAAVLRRELGEDVQGWVVTAHR